MISSKGIRILCYISMTCSCLISVILIIHGIGGVADDNEFSFIWIILGLVLPLIVSVSMYPIFALANIDENISQINQKLDERALKIPQRTEMHEPQSPQTIIENYAMDSTENQKHEETLIQHTTSTEKLKETIDFINKKYDIQIEIGDTLETIRLKVANITKKSSSANILINKVLNANDMQTVISAFILHKSAHS